MSIFGAEIPFASHCEIETVGVFDGVTRLRVNVEPHLSNHLGMAHGGLTCTLLDIALATAARTATGRTVITLDMQIAFLNPGTGVLIGEGRVVRPGRSVIFCEGEVRREADGVLVAKASGLFKPVGAERPATAAADG